MKIHRIFLSAVLFISSIKSALSVRTKISVYYESLCPYSVDFIRNKFYPHYKYLKSHISMDWLPYGKTNQTLTNGEWKFSCQHGKDECKANKYQACAIDEGHGQDNNVEFINCVLSSYPAHTPVIQSCALRFKFNWKDISNCYNSRRSDDLLASLGLRTHALRPKLRMVPVVVYNGKFDKFLSRFSRENFLNATCSQIPNPQPDIC